MRRRVEIEIEEFDYCYNQCKYRNYYDGWCYYYNNEASEVEECEYIHKVMKERDKRFE